MPAADLDRLLDRLPEPVDRDHDVLAHLATALRGDRVRRAVTPAPQGVDLAGVSGPVDEERVLAQSLGQLLVDAPRLLGAAIGVHDDHEAGLVRELDRKRAAGSFDGTRVEVLERGRYDAAGVNALDRGAARFDALVDRDERQRLLGRGDQLDPGGGDDPQRALRADQQGLEVVPGHVLADRAADGDGFTGREDGLEPGDPRAGDAVLERVRAAGVGGDVAAELRLLG